MITKVGLAVAAIALSATARAAPEHELGNLLQTEVGHRYTQEYISCYDTTIKGMDRFGCTQEEMLQQDKQLNVVYRRVIARLNPARANDLRQSQRKWMASRDGKCHSHGVDLGEFDPSDDKMSNPWCVLDETIRRTIWLENLR